MLLRTFSTLCLRPQNQDKEAVLLLLFKTDELVRASQQVWMMSLQIQKGKVTLQVLASGQLWEASAVFLPRHSLSAQLTIN